MQLPNKLAPFIQLDNLCYEDKLDLLIVATQALKQCHSNSHYEIDLLNALENSDCTQDAFEGITESHEFLEVTLTEVEWIQFSQAVLTALKLVFEVAK
ncbi:hypothetical protein [Oxynema aestuarii]|jgi:hypothetical protein|uniref:Uncharacterized protein n=1 Tax=Oxynema aestuarii AP17 TaxID=2064643 RepID=A0A6H1U2A7_9CYAN|nr:hypothetical protein [Oxynema aestuarii]QIZ73008.1 hypothetical protein HCG48_22370 [Oxynema aestuarii AP17]